MKLIPFKKRQFNELQFEEIKLKKQIEAARSKSNTPRRLSDSSDNLRSSPPLVISTSPAPEEEELMEDDNASSEDVSEDNKKAAGEMSEEEKKVSPLKLSLRGVLMRQPSSSSNSTDPLGERVTVSSHLPSHWSQDEVI